MENLLIFILVIAYAGTGIVGVVAYWPTITDLYRHKKPSANINSYILWTTTSGIAFLYSIFVLPDLLFIIVSGLNFVACALVLILAIGLKKVTIPNS